MEHGENDVQALKLKVKTEDTFHGGEGKWRSQDG